MPKHELIVRRPPQAEPEPELVDGPASHGDVLGLRSHWTGPVSAKSPEIARIIGSGGPTLSGIAISEETALTSSPVFCAVAMASDDVGSLPLHLYKRLDGGGKDRYDAHPLYRLVHDAPNTEMDAMVFRRTMQAHLMLWQNAYAEIERNGAGQPVALWPLVPESVTPFRGPGGALRYRVTNPSGGEVELPAADMIHLVGHGHTGTVGASLVVQARESIALGLAAEKFGASFFGNGATFGGVISYKGPKPPELADENYRKSLNARHQGVERAYRLMSLFNDANYTPIGTNPNEGQFNETRIHQVREVARWFRMPPHKLGDLADATYSNVEQMDAAYYSSCIRPYLILWEQQLNRKLVSPLERRQQFIEHDTHGFLSVDAAARSELYSAEFNVGSITPNEIRGYENRNPLKGGDRSFVPLNMIPLDRLDEYLDAQIAKMKEPPPEPPKVAPQDDADRQALRQAVAALEQAVAAERTGRENEAAEKRTAQQRAEDLSAALEQESAAKDAALADLVHVRELLAGAEQAIGHEQTERERMRAWAEDVTAMEQRHRHEAEAQRDGLQARLDSALAAQAASVEALAAVEAARQADQATHAAERDALQAERDEAVIARDLRQVVADTALGEARQAIADKSAAEQRAEAAERDKAIAEQAQAAANATIADLQSEIQRSKQAQAERVAGILVAHRGLVVDVMRRMVEREIDRAKRHQTTPQKFRAWVDTFYQTHAESVAEALLPAVRAHLSILSSTSDPYEMARTLAEDHVAESAKQLRDLLYVEDFAPMLERTLAQWETARPERVADCLLTKGLADVR